MSFQGKKAFAFDTKFGHRIYGSAGGKIEEQLKELGFEIVKTSVSAIVERWYGPLEEGSEEKFRQIGSEIAKQILS